MKSYLKLIRNFDVAFGKIPGNTVFSGLRIRITLMRIRIQRSTLVGTDPYQDPHQSDANLRPLVYRVQGFILILYAAIVSAHGPSRLHFKPLKLLNFASGSTFKNNADPVPDPGPIFFT